MKEIDLFLQSLKNDKAILFGASHSVVSCEVLGFADVEIPRCLKFVTSDKYQVTRSCRTMFCEDHIPDIKLDERASH